MLETSLTFNPYINSRHSDLRVSFRLVDLDAFSDAVASASFSEDISQLEQTHDEIELMGDKWGTFETDGWILDGTFALPPDSISGIQTGWWSGLSGADGNFSSAPTLTFNFSEDHSSIGFTIIFDDKANWYPKEFNVSAYNSSDDLIDDITVICTGVKQVVDMPVLNYRKLVLTFNSTRQPYQRVRVTEVAFGIVQSFDKNNITLGEISYEVSPIAENLPTHELEITIDNSDKKYNLINPASIYAYLQQGQPLKVEIGIEGEYVNMGTFYFAKSSAEDSALTAKITAYDLFYRLGKSVCKIGVTGIWTVAAAVAAVLTDSGLTITTDIPALVGARTIGKAIPQKATHREALRLIAQAGLSTCYFDRNGILTFVEMVEGTSVDTLDNDNMISVPKVSVKDRINTVNLTVNDEYADSETVYTAEDVLSGETAQVLSVENPLGNQEVADWLLLMAQKRLFYELDERGNPAREITDTITVYDAYLENKKIIVTKEELKFNGALNAKTEGVR